MTDNGALASVQGLKKCFPIPQGIIIQRRVGDIKAVDGVAFDIMRGETLDLAGESGCGKTTIGRANLQLRTPTAGKGFFEGEERRRQRASGCGRCAAGCRWSSKIRRLR